MINALNLKAESFVVEIGSNDGYLSEQFKKSGLKAIGVDPSPYMAELAKQRDVDTIINLFDEEVGNLIVEKYGKADLIAANNVYNHSNNPLEFTKAVANTLAPKGYFVFEQPYWLTTIQSGKFDQIYHEHVSYYTVKSVKKLLERAGMKIKSAGIVTYHGESLRVIAQLASELKEESEEVRKIIEEEEKYGLFSEELYKKYMDGNIKSRNSFLEKIYKIKNEGASIIAVGAPAKGNTFLNFYNLDNNILDYVTDSSPHKKGKFTPATRIPIVGDEIFGEYLNKKVYALVLSWNIVDQLRPILNKINPNIEFLAPEEPKIIL
jgi:SAM-dependent methyltransferase